MSDESVVIEEVNATDQASLEAYLAGASRDGTLSRIHNTFRFCQANLCWLSTLQLMVSRLGARSWIYREGKDRTLWVLETSHLPQPPILADLDAVRAFVPGYFDAEGGVPRRAEARFYVQFVQKDRADLEDVAFFLRRLGIGCGRIHNPSVAIDPDYWRFYVATASHQEFALQVGS